MTNPPISAAAEFESRIKTLEQERAHLLAVVEILEEISGSLHFVDIMQSITQKLGEMYGLDRCSIFLAEGQGTTARLVASYEDPAIRNHLVDLQRYPELQRALQSNETVFIPDAAADPNMQHIAGALTDRGAKSITVVPIAAQGNAIGAIFLRTFRDGPSFTEEDVKFCQVVGTLTARALRTAYRYERLEERFEETSVKAKRASMERLALVEFLKRLLNSFGSNHADQEEKLLSETAKKELERLTNVAMT
ncbi:MAG: GAF domain-containing protein, partial [Gemmatimonadota bacterium]|nr:GAF domain-containing protein [Gemmatimonadota bacterium]